MKGSNDLAKTEQEVYDGGKRETQFCRLLFCLLDLRLLLFYSPVLHGPCCSLAGERKQLFTFSHHNPGRGNET